MKKYLFLLFFLAGLFSLSSCSTYSEKETSEFDKQIQMYVKKQPVKYEKSDSGLYYYIENEGEGSDFIKLTDEVTFVYEGKFLGGEVFDKHTVDDPVTYKTRVLIGGWKEVFAYLKEGGKCKIVVPPQLGYGDHDLKDIPKHSILVFDIEILDVN